MSYLYPWCPKYTAQDDPTRAGCSFTNTDGTAQILRAQGEWVQRRSTAEIREMERHWRCRVHGVKPKIYRVHNAWITRINPVWTKVWRREWRDGQYQYVRIRPQPPTHRSTCIGA